MKFLDKRNNEIKEAFSIKVKEEKVYIKFTENGKEYAYKRENIEVLAEETNKVDKCPFVIYRLTKHCYKCQKDTSILTYIVFDDGTNQDVTFPWDKRRLLRNQNLEAHFLDSSIEYYGLKVIGGDEQLDEFLMEKFPEKIQRRYSNIQKRSYPMNLCDHCGAIQGWNYVYRQVNEMIKDMQEIERLEE